MGLNEEFQEQLINITNNIRPSFSEIVDKFFVASERYCSVQKKYKTEKSNESKYSDGHKYFSESQTTNAFASNVSYQSGSYNKSSNFRQCLLCPKKENSPPTHPIYKCEKYPDAKSKIKRIVELNGCVKCGYTNHKEQSCRYKFASKCRSCGRWHQSFLCPGGSGDYKSSGSNSVPLNTMTVVVSNVLSGTIPSDCMLPTFSLNVNETLIRGVKDSGSQGNFIEEDLANRLNLRVIEGNLNLKLIGINVPQSYKSKIVEIEGRFGDCTHVIEAITIPSVNISLNLSCLGKVVRKFNTLNIELADKFLRVDENKIENIKFILGTKSTHCVPGRDIVIGGATKSVYSETPCGVTFEGDVSLLLSNLDKHSFDNGVTVDAIKPICSFTSVISKSEFDSPAPCDSDSFEVLCNGRVVLPQLHKATNSMLSEYCERFTHYDQAESNDVDSDLNNSLVKFALDNLKINSENRIVIPLFWNSAVSHLLGKNFDLAKSVLKSNLKKLKKDPTLMRMMDQTFREQEEAGIIQRIGNFEQFAAEYPNHSFMAHMGVYRMDSEFSKCRIVYLSNLCQRIIDQKVTVSHNQAIHSGPNLNQKLSSAILNLRFDPLLICFDISKAFNCISLNEVDQNRLLLLWYRNVEKGDFTVVPFKHVRLSFGVRCSPTILMLALYYILVLNVRDDDDETKNMKSLIYQLSYMDNLAVTASNRDQLTKFYHSLRPIFDEFGFPLQQFVSNCTELQSSIDDEFDVETKDEVKLLGLNWNRVEDTLSTRKINLDADAKNKRAILSSIAAQFDIYNFNGPLLNRARVFLHELQCNKTIDWDDKLSTEQLREWGNICHQANSSPVIKIDRFVGDRSGRYKLVAFSDSSQTIYGCVIYLLDLDSNKLSFLTAKNRIVNKQMEGKSIPSLEMQGIVLAVECLVDVRNELSGNHCIYPITIESMMVYSDSLVCLSWINAHTSKFDKLQKRTVFVQNRLLRIAKLCENFPITFTFVSGMENPADCMTRCLSYRKLMKTSFICGPSLVYSDESTLSREDILSVTVPNPCVLQDVPVQMTCSTVVHCDLGYANNLLRFSKFTRLRGVYSRVLIFINYLKRRIGRSDVKDVNYNFLKESVDFMMRQDQKIHYSDILTYFSVGADRLKDVPNLVNQLNVYVDNRNLLRVKSKFGRMVAGKLAIFPILLAKKSRLTELFIEYFHVKMSHSGVCNVLSELRQLVWIPHCYSVVKKILKNCVVCRRFKSRPISLNQSPYRENRIDPSQVPYRYIYMDYFGPYNARTNAKKSKVYILCITCMYTRAINLKVCIDLTVGEFLRAFQMHSFEFGVPTSVVSDLGTQLVAGGNIIKDFLKDPVSSKYFEENNVTQIMFEQYPKGNSALGSLVESCVKLTKRLIFGAIHNNVLVFRDFEFLIAQTVHIVNKRPIAFKSSLRDSDTDEFLNTITPENLLRGHDLLSVNLIPSLQPDVDEDDPDWNQFVGVSSVRESSSSLRKVRESLLSRYHKDFLVKLIDQAVDVKDRYRSVQHSGVKVGDIVLIKEPNTKITNYPMGLVKTVTTNINDEVTDATVLKGSTRELVKRHSSTLIPLLSPVDSLSDVTEVQPPRVPDESVDRPVDRPQRKAAISCRSKIRNQSLS